MAKWIVGGMLIVTFILGVITANVIRTEPVFAASGTVQSWGLIEDPSGQPRNVLVLFDSSTGEVWGYPEKGGLHGTPVRIGTLVKVGSPLAR